LTAILKNITFSRPSQTTTFQDPFSEEVWRTTYRDFNDHDINDTFWRVAQAIASVEITEELRHKWSNNFYKMMTDFHVIPGGRILANAGTEFKGTSLINCFVSPLPKHDADSMIGIIDILRAQTLTLKSEGGWGNNFSVLRPRGAFINGIGVETPGSVKFMELFDKSSEIITSGSGLKSSNKKAKGKIRKGAMMGVLDVWHPDIIEFITAKQTANRLQKFNVSVNCVDAFMEKVLQVYTCKQEGIEQEIIDEITWDLIFPQTKHAKYKSEWKGDIVDWQQKGYAVDVYKTVKVEWLWNLITQSTYNRNEPGILFLDRANKFNQLNYLEKIASTNPCGEQMLAPGSICCLGTLNLTQFVNVTRTGFDISKVKKYVTYLVRFLDNVNSYSDAPLPEYVEAMRKKRRIGCGMMGWGSALYMMKVRFGSEHADKIRSELLKAFTHAGVEASLDLADEKGMFEFCDPEKHVLSPYWDNIDLPVSMRNRIRKNGIRNSSLFSMQPNGNSSIFGNIVTGGIEPVFLHGYIRTVIVGVTPDHILELTPKWYEGAWNETEMFKFNQEGDEQILRGIDKFGTVYKIDKNRGLTKEVLCQDYGVRYLENLNEWDAKAEWAVTTDDLSVDDHISDLKGFAKAVDSACSKTVNLPNDYNFEDFQHIYLDAFQTGFIKGLTTYRKNSMTSVLSAVDQKTDSDEEIILDDIKLQDTSLAEIKVLRDYEGGSSRKWYCTVGLNANKAPISLFVQTNAMEKTVTTNDAVDKLLALARKKGIPEKFVTGVEEKFVSDNNSTKIARAIGLLLRHGVRVKNIVSEIDKIEGITFSSFLFHIKKLLASYVRDGEKIVDAKCTECGGQLVFESGCQKCINCGGSKCG
jgi:ribonucleoside-diphosphate reductase alpha chain